MCIGRLGGEQTGYGREAMVGTEHIARRGIMGPRTLDGLPPAGRPIRICFFFNAQMHQLLHGISTAVCLSRLPGVEVDVRSPSVRHIHYARKLIERLGGGPIRCSSYIPPLLARTRTVFGGSVPPKLLTLMALARELNHFDAIALPERTSMVLRRFGVNKPLFIHLDHGAGDRAAGFDPRIRLFDFVLMAGEKHRVRLMRDGMIREGTHAVVGYPKFDAADAIRQEGWRPFANNRLTVLYNPHFADIGSWEKCGAEVMRQFAEQQQYNLIVAPHVRLLDNHKSRARWQSLLNGFSGLNHILVDPGSHKSMDMSYTMAADIYLGDVSSQIYEFLRCPRPCLFLNPHRVAWENDENYAHWRFGPVLSSTSGLIEAVDAAYASHPLYEAVQQQAFAETFSISGTTASERAAQAIAGYLHGQGVGTTGRNGQEEKSPSPIHCWRPRLSPPIWRVRQLAAVVLLLAVGWFAHDCIAAQADTPMTIADEAVQAHDSIPIGYGEKEQSWFTDAAG